VMGERSGDGWSCLTFTFTQEWGWDEMRCVAQAVEQMSVVVRRWVG
jgi:hypothetical protein